MAINLQQDKLPDYIFTSDLYEREQEILKLREDYIKRVEAEYKEEGREYTFVKGFRHWRAECPSEAIELINISFMFSQLDDYRYPLVIVREDYLETYAIRCWEGCNAKISWPTSCIDWKKAASRILVYNQPVQFRTTDAHTKSYNYYCTNKLPYEEQKNED